VALAAYATGEPEGVHQWLLHCTLAYAAGAEAATDLVGR
jgi:hypothetical protein